MNAEAADFWSRARQALRTAKNLERTDPDASASRAYYAAFYAVSALFALEGKTFAKHSTLRAALHRDLVKTGRWSVERGEDYSLLLKLRDTGDYGGGIHVSNAEATEAVEAARRILNAVQATSPEPFPQTEDE
jgi:uncharacterized protein (UPF0332 family)